MEQIIIDILTELRAGRQVDDRMLLKFVHAAAKRSGGDKSRFAKRRLLPYYQRVKREDPDRWTSWGVTDELERRLMDVLRMKPRRSASGVATITVITKPWPCGSDCLYCPNDIRMPKSYLHNEPACERAEQNLFDPYLQVSTRLLALSQMGHAVDKIELIVLGGTWSDYPQGYQVWFIKELFRALNDGVPHGLVPGADVLDEGEKGPAAAAPCEPGAAAPCEPAAAAPCEPGAAAPCDSASTTDLAPAAREVLARRALYESWGIAPTSRASRERAEGAQRDIDVGRSTYNEAFARLYASSPAWSRAASGQNAAIEELEREQRRNERARHRVVGLVIETRPDAVTPASLTLIRRLGATKIQMGIQSLDQRILDQNDRGISVGRIQRAFELLRVFGFKIHAHAMVNLYGADPELDKRDFERLVREAPFQPDEIKLYPCALIEGARLCRKFEEGTWAPYTEEQLLDVLVADVAATPPFCRISRMIRDFSSLDIKAGNKKPNLRQLVEGRVRENGTAGQVQEIRFREVGTAEVDAEGLSLDEVPYATSNTRERFLQWVTPDNGIAGFLRLSLPDAAYIEEHRDELPVRRGDAMIREVHVYGMATALGASGSAVQHLGLGRSLVARACEIAQAEGYRGINVISAVGTREYYRSLGFVDDGLYQRKELS